MTQQTNISKKRLKIHETQTKIESSLIIQIRIEKIELTDFLYVQTANIKRSNFEMFFD